jgi:hypothetical protein
MIGELLQEWIDKESHNLTFGELTITLKYHDGKLVLVEKNKSEKQKLNNDKTIPYAI